MIEKVRRRKNDNATYLGPFGNTGLLNIMLKTVFKIFPLIRCSRYTLKSTKRPCNYYHMKMCMAPCVDKVSRGEYIEMVKNAVDLLKGKNSILKKDLKMKMKIASEAQEYEKAANYRDQIYAIDNIAEEQNVIVNCFENGDIINCAEDSENIVFHIVLIRDSKVIGGESFSFPLSAEDSEEILVSFLLQYYNHRPLPEKVVLSEVPEDIDSIIVAISEEDRDKSCKVLKGSRGEYRELLEMAAKNAEHKLLELQGDQKKRKVELELLAEAAHLQNIPNRIECIDISNMQSSAIVASDICFINGTPAKEYYRRYKIKNVEDAPNDFASIEEVVERRIKSGIEDGDLPDLLIIDGGKGQLKSALSALSKVRRENPEVDLPIISLAKSRVNSEAGGYAEKTVLRSKERIFLPHRKDPIELDEAKPLFRLLTRIRDEAHRFAITYHRSRRAKDFKLSVLDEVRGIGPVIKRRLLQIYGSIERMEKADVSELRSIKGIREEVAKELYEKLHQK